MVVQLREEVTVLTFDDVTPNLLPGLLETKIKKVLETPLVEFLNGFKSGQTKTFKWRIDRLPLIFK